MTEARKASCSSVPDNTDDAVYIAALHVGIDRKTTKALLGTLDMCGFKVVRKDEVDDAYPVTKETK